MARTKNAYVVDNPREREVIPDKVASESSASEEEEQEEAATEGEANDSEATKSVSPQATDSEDENVESEGESRVMGPLKMYFPPDQYLAPIKLSAKCYISTAVENLERILKRDELNYFREHPQFCHFFHMPKEANHKLMGMWLLLVRNASIEKTKECWFVVNGVPIRYSLRELALLSGLNCRPYPPFYQSSGGLDTVGRVFGRGAKITYDDVEKKLFKMKAGGDRLNIAVLYFLSSIIVGQKKTGKQASSVEKFFLRAVNNLELCKTFPWGRFAFDQNMKDIGHIITKFEGKTKASWIFSSFVLPLEILAFEAIPVLRNNFREDIAEIAEVSPECPRMCKSKFKKSAMKGFSNHELAETLGTTKEIHSILEPSIDEQLMLARIAEPSECDVSDGVVDGWYKRLDEGKTLWFGDHFNKDVASRECENVAKTTEDVATGVGENVAMEGVVENVIKEKLLEMESRMVIALAEGLKEGFKQIKVDLDALAKRVTSLEEKRTEKVAEGETTEDVTRENPTETTEDVTRENPTERTDGDVTCENEEDQLMEEAVVETTENAAVENPTETTDGDVTREAAVENQTEKEDGPNSRGDELMGEAAGGEPSEKQDDIAKVGEEEKEEQPSEKQDDPSEKQKGEEEKEEDPIEKEGGNDVGEPKKKREVIKRISKRKMGATTVVRSPVMTRAKKEKKG